MVRQKVRDHTPIITKWTDRRDGCPFSCFETQEEAFQMIVRAKSLTGWSASNNDLYFNCKYLLLVCLHV